MWVSLKRQGLTWRRADLLIAVSGNIADELEKFYHLPSDKIRVVHNGVDVDVFKPVDEGGKGEARRKLGIKGGPVILYVGHLSPRKGIRYLLMAASKVVKEFPEALFVFLGGTPKFVGDMDYQRVWVDLASELGVSGNVLFAGEVKHRATLDYYAAADIFAFPTLYEGLAKALLEAMACGLPVVTTSAGGNPEAVVHEETGLLVEPYSPGQLANALIRVLSDSSLAEDMGSRGRKKAERYFTWGVTARKVMTVYEELL